MFWDILDLSDGLPEEETVVVLNNLPCCAQINENGVTIPAYGGAIVPAADKILQTGLAAGYFINVAPRILGLNQPLNAVEADPKPRRGRPKQESVDQPVSEEVVIELQEEVPVEIVLEDSAPTEK